MENETILSIFTDGGSRGNPGQAALGVFVIDQHQQVLFQLGKKLGVATNNVAEYQAVIAALDWLEGYIKQSPSRITVTFYLDSLLVVSQIKGLWKVKNPQLSQLLYIIQEKVQELHIRITYQHIPREQNKKADKLVNMALDNQL